MVNGHDHVYERSEIPDGPTLITSGGGGGRLYRSRSAGPPNPFTKVFRSTHHYLKFHVGPDGASMRAIDLEGSEIDRCEWPICQTN
jgi:hypothetical protein